VFTLKFSIFILSNLLSAPSFVVFPSHGKGRFSPLTALSISSGVHLLVNVVGANKEPVPVKASTIISYFVPPVSSLLPPKYPFRVSTKLFIFVLAPSGMVHVTLFCSSPITKLIDQLSAFSSAPASFNAFLTLVIKESSELSLIIDSIISSLSFLVTQSRVSDN